MFEEYMGFKHPAKVKAGCSRLGVTHARIHLSNLKIICVLDGSIIVSDSFSDYLLKEDDIHIVNPTYPYYFHEADENYKSTLLVVEIDLEYYKRFFSEITDNLYLTCHMDPHNHIFDEYLKYIRFLLAKIFFTCVQKEPNEVELETMTKTLLSFLLEYFQHYILKKDDSGDFKILLNTELKMPYDPKRIYRIIDYIYDHLHEKLKLEDIAEKEYLSTWYLSRYIKETSGLSFSEHLSMARCERAEELLITTSKTIDNIALEVGLANRQHLTTQFKRWFKLSPSRYRKRFLEGSGGKREEEESIDFEKIIPILQSYLE